MAAAAVQLDPSDEAMLSSQEKCESKKAAKARESVGERFDAFLKEKKMELSTESLKQFIRAEAKTCAPTTLSTRFSHTQRYVKKHYRVSFTKAQLESIYTYIQKKMDRYMPNKASYFTHEHVKRVLESIEVDDLVRVRDALIFVFGIYCLGRVSEIYDLARDDVTVRENCIEIVVNRRKSDRGHQEQRFLVPGTVEGVAVLPLWEAYAAKVTEGWLWRRITDKMLPRLGKGSVEEVTKQFAERLGLDNPDSYTFHGLRATGATFMSDAGASEIEIMQAGNWKSTNVAKEYIRRSEAAMKRRAALISGEPPDKKLKTEPLHPQAPQPQETAPTPNPLAHTFSNCTFTNCTFVLP